MTRTMGKVIGKVWLVGISLAVACGGNAERNPRGNGLGDGESQAGSNATFGATGSGAATNGSGGASTGSGVGTPGSGGRAVSGGVGNLAGDGTVVFGGAPDRGGTSNAGSPDLLGGAPSDGGAPLNGGEPSDGGVASYGGDDGLPPTGCACASDQACIVVTVNRTADTSRQPWVLWPAQADGVGILRVSSVSESYTIQDKAIVVGASFVDADASYQVPLCVPPGKNQLRAYLDDNEDENPNQPSSGDYLDSCSAPPSAACFRCYNVDTSAGAKLRQTISLAQSCD